MFFFLFLELKKKFSLIWIYISKWKVLVNEILKENYYYIDIKINVIKIEKKVRGLIKYVKLFLVVNYKYKIINN